MQYTVTNKGAIKLSPAHTAQPGEILTDADFAKIPKALPILLAAGNLMEGAQKVVPSFDPDRGMDLPPLPVDAKGNLTGISSKTEPEHRTRQALAKIRQEKDALEAAKSEHQQKLEALEGEELTISEAKAHGLTKK